MSTTDYKLIVEGSRYESDDYSRGTFYQLCRRYGTWQHAILAIFVVFPYVAIPILFGEVSSLQNQSCNNNYYSTTTTSSTSINLPLAFDTASKRSSAATIPTPVSVFRNGDLQIGAGTSIYLNISTSFSAACPSHLGLATIYDFDPSLDGTSAYLISYIDEASQMSSIDVIQVNDVTKTSTIRSSTSFNFTLYELTTLHQAGGTFVFITTDSSSTAETAFIVAGKVSLSLNRVALGSPTLYADIYSLNPQITRLSDTTFALTYFNISSDFNEVSQSYLLTRYGRVLSDLSVSLSDPVIVAQNADYGLYATIVGLTTSQYFITYYNSASTFSDGGYLLGVAAIINSSGLVTLSLPTTLSNSRPAYALTMSRIDNNTAVVAYADILSNYGIRAVVLSTNFEVSAGVIFGSSVMVTSGQTLTTLDDYDIMDIDIETISSNFGSDRVSGVAGASLAILFSDVSNNAATELAILSITSTGQLQLQGPTYALNSGNPNFQLYYSWGALAPRAGLTSAYNAQMAINVLINDIACTQSPSFSFSMMVMLPEPIGITLDLAATSPETIVSGAVSGFSNLIPGKAYYTTTQGQLVTSSELYYGSTPTYIETDNVIVSANSFIGLAISSTTILLQK